MLNKMLTLFKKDWFTGDILCKIPFYHLYFFRVRATFDARDCGSWNR